MSVKEADGETKKSKYIVGTESFLSSANMYAQGQFTVKQHRVVFFCRGWRQVITTKRPFDINSSGQYVL